MNPIEITGLMLVAGGGLASGLGAAPVKLMKRFDYEHWALIYSLTGMLLLPWAIACAACPDFFQALSAVPLSVYVKANACSIAWGVANILANVCLLRIGLCLSMAIVTGVGLPIGILLPTLVKGSGQFADAPSLFSRQGAMLGLVTLVLMVSVVLVSQAGAEREKAASAAGARGRYASGVLMMVLAGVLQVGLSFAFVYSQGPLMAALTARGAETWAATAGVWAVALFGGAMVNALFAAWVLRRNRSAGKFALSRDFACALAMGLLFTSLLLCMGNGMRLLGALGASLGFGVYQGLQTLTAQGVGVAAGEWRGASAKAKALLAGSVVLILLAIGIIASSKMS